MLGAVAAVDEDGWRSRGWDFLLISPLICHIWDAATREPDNKRRKRLLPVWHSAHPIIHLTVPLSARQHFSPRLLSFSIESANSDSWC